MYPIKGLTVLNLLTVISLYLKIRCKGETTPTCGATSATVSGENCLIYKNTLKAPFNPVRSLKS